MLSSSLNRVFIYCKNNPWLVLMFLLGAMIRIVYIGSIPPGLNQDEASIGYDAYAILHYGIDRNGIHLPIHLIAWGSGQNALYAYLSMPFIWLFGLSPVTVRMASLLMGLVGMVVFYLLSKRLFSSQVAGLAAMFFIAINPWHIMMSRWALESNLFPTLILIAVYCLLRSFEAPKWSYAFTVVLSLSLYAYGTAYFFVPIFALGTVILLLYRKVLKLRTILWNGVLFILLALPILSFIMINRYQLQGFSTPFFSIPRLTTPRVEQVSSVFGGQMLDTAWSNLREFFKIMLSGSDGLPWNSISPYGYAYSLGLPFVLVGLIVIIKSLRNRDCYGTGQSVILLWFVTAILMAAITSVNINRINVIFYPVILLIVAGFLWLGRKIKGAGLVAAGGFALFFVLFGMAYFRDFPEKIGPNFYESIGEAIQYASEETEGNIYVTDKVNMPYIYVLFYETINPHDFLETVSYANPGAPFQLVSSFGRYRFGGPTIIPGERAAYIFWNGDPLPAGNEGYEIKRFKNYTVVVDREGISPVNPQDTEGEDSRHELMNGGFEEGALHWTFTAGTGIGTNNPYQGSSLAYLDPGTEKTVAQLISPQNSGEYKISAMISAGGGGGKFGVRVNGAILTETELTEGASYHQIELPAVSLQKGEQAEIYFTGGNGWINIDEVRMEQ
ncbi:glycosyltransferase family 39 protein [Paenibacillus agri]|uniref:Glycosyltransferase family 39 protein n=1 Tax=Paenibacillus agri TaxID=2744309 RepID=A0A850EPC0_9BACL|nr:glycosyltransferase family 39 protein [Paenibacillus agri]NUU61610.1 glycosyltransferase family 39 protein [Paenibacillus agri]